MTVLKKPYTSRIGSTTWVHVCAGKTCRDPFSPRLTAFCVLMRRRHCVTLPPRKNVGSFMSLSPPLNINQSDRQKMCGEGGCGGTGCGSRNDVTTADDCCFSHITELCSVKGCAPCMMDGTCFFKYCFACKQEPSPLP